MSSRSACELRDELPWLEGSILAAMRTWVLGCKRGVSTEVPVQVLFANLRASEAAAELDRFMQALNRGCTRMIEVSCTCEPLLSDDEALLLDMFALLQQGGNPAATVLLARLVEPAAAHLAAGPALAVIQVVAEAGHVLTRGPAAWRRYGDDSEEAFPGGSAITMLH